MYIESDMFVAMALGVLSCTLKSNQMNGQPSGNRDENEK